MDFLDGLKLNEVPDSNKDKFCSLVAKFGIKSIFFDGFTHGDLHQGNCRFLIDKDENGDDVEKLIIYDFGILCYIEEDEKDIMYRVCKNFFAKKYEVAGKIILDEITGPDEIRNKLSEEDYNALLEITTVWSRDTIGEKKIVAPTDIHNLSVDLSKYNLKTKDWFGKIIMSFAVHESMAKALSVNKTFLEYAEELVKETEDILG
jgi:predicted unusual protein kinase regulating ubiquinone biosynthesis (AarF/ABC1/UbiB family)